MVRPTVVFLSLGWLLLACGDAPDPRASTPLDVESLGLSESERADYSPVGFDEVMGIASSGDTTAAEKEAFRRRHDDKVVAWRGTIRTIRAVLESDRSSEIRVEISARSERRRFFPETLTVTFGSETRDEVRALGEGAPIAFVGRLRFDGRSREPWVIDARPARAD